MKNLIELVQIIKNSKISTGDIFIPDNKNSKANQLFNGIYNGKFLTDNDAALFLFDNDATFGQYKNLKHTFKNKLLNSLFILNPKSVFSDYEKAYLYCSKNILAAKILFFLQAHNISVEIFSKVYNKAKKFQITEYVVESSRYLRLHYGNRDGDVVKFTLYNTTYKKQINLLLAETKVEEYISTFMLPYISKKRIKSKDLEDAQEMFAKVTILLKNHFSPYLYFLGNYIHIMILMTNNDFKKAVIKCKKAVSFFQSLGFSYKTPVRIFLHNQIICFINLRKHIDGKEALVQSNLYLKKGSHSWFVNQELGLLLAFSSRAYTEAADILAFIIHQPKFKYLPYAVRERWLLYEAYVQFLFKANVISTTAKIKKHFRLGKFINSVPVLSKDKEGINISILIVYILFLIIRKEYNSVYEKIETLEKYRGRYINKNPKSRTNYFMKMLIKIPHSNFNKIAVQRNTVKLRTQLESTPFKYMNKGSELEIIPYEDLWEIIINSLSKAQTMNW